MARCWLWSNVAAPGSRVAWSNRPRVVVAEILDGLADDDPAARRSRRDLARIHRCMGTQGIIARRLRRSALGAGTGQARLSVLELGAGDGTVLLGVARKLRSHWPPVVLSLLDRANLVRRSTVERYARFGWRAVPKVADVHAWAARDDGERWDLIVANLFLHHFDGAELDGLLAAVAARTRCFLACEPRRGWAAAVASRLVGVIGASAVTRADAVVSVDAGFRDLELGARWPLAHTMTSPSATSGSVARSPAVTGPARWVLHESAAGLFTHCFYAERLTP